MRVGPGTRSALKLAGLFGLGELGRGRELVDLRDGAGQVGGGHEIARVLRARVPAVCVVAAGGTAALVAAGSNGGAEECDAEQRGDRDTGGGSWRAHVGPPIS